MGRLAEYYDYLREIEHFDLVAKLEADGPPAGRRGMVENLVTRVPPDYTTAPLSMQARDEASKRLGRSVEPSSGDRLRHWGNQRKGSLER